MANFLGDIGSSRAVYPGSKRVAQKAMQRTATPVQQKPQTMMKKATPVQQKSQTMMKKATPVQQKSQTMMKKAVKRSK